jgi:hypothetical protein
MAGGKFPSGCLNALRSFNELKKEYCTDPKSDRCTALSKAFRTMSAELCSEGDTAYLSVLLDRLVELAGDIDSAVDEAYMTIEIIEERFKPILGGSLRQLSHDFITPLKSDAANHKLYIDGLRALHNLLRPEPTRGETEVGEPCVGCSVAEILKRCDFDADCITAVTKWLREEREKGHVPSDDELVKKAKELRREK